jgi:hypothetical protein
MSCRLAAAQLRAAADGGRRLGCNNLSSPIKRRSMLDTCERNGAPAAGASAVLMARIVDTAGDVVARSAVASIKYSIVEVGREHGGKPRILPGYDRVELDVDQVFLDTLEFGKVWTIDEKGYNFRHVIEVNAAAGFPKRNARYEVRYEFTAVTGERSLMRFELRMD